MSNPFASPRRLLTLALTLPGLALFGCGADQDAGSETTSSSDQAAGEDREGGPSERESKPKEVRDEVPRLVATYDGGITVLDATTLKRERNFDLPGFNRLNPAGDGRHVLISTEDEFRVLDVGSYTQAHGDHGHHYAGTPRLTDVAFPADHPGHVVHHGDRTVLFSDGNGRIESFDPDDLADGRPKTEVTKADEAHHGVAVGLPSGGMVVSVGDEETRSGAKVLDASGKAIASNADCPGLHGEAHAADDVLLFGCEDGALTYRDGKFHKTTAPDDYGRIGNQAGSEESPIVLGDYKVDADAELERPERVSLVDTSNDTLKLVDLGASYSFRSLARGPHGEGLVLGTDGAIHVIDPEKATVTTKIPVLDAWKEPTDWQQPRPTITVIDHTAYVTDPAGKRIHAVDIEKGEVTKSAPVPGGTDELVGLTG